MEKSTSLEDMTAAEPCREESPLLPFVKVEAEVCEEFFLNQYGKQMRECRKECRLRMIRNTRQYRFRYYTNFGLYG